jgi:hypothetical protein
MILLLRVLVAVLLLVAFFVIWAGLTSTLGILERILVLGVGGLIIWGANRLRSRAV